MLILLGKISKYVYNSLYKGSNMNLDKCKPHWWHVYFKQYLILDSYFAVICTGIWLLRHKIIWNYFWSEIFLKFIIIFNKCKVYTWTYMQYSMLPYDMVVYDTLWTLCTEYQYWNFPFEFDFCAAILTFVLVFFFLWFALYHFDERTVEYMYLFNS